MSNFLDRNVGWLNGLQERTCSEPIDVRIASAWILGIDCVMGKTEIGTEISPGVIQSWRSTDFLIAARLLLLEGKPVEPHRSWTLHRTVGNRRVSFQVLPADDGRTWRWSDEPMRTVMRIHAKEVGAE